MKAFPMLVASTIAASFAHAGGVDFDFEDQSIGFIPGETLVLTSQGVDVTFSGLGLNIRDLPAAFSAGNVLSSSGDTGPITVSFSQNIEMVSFENLINGRFTGEVDEIDGWAYDSDDNLVDSFTASTSDFAVLTGDISYVVWEASSTGFVVDNVSFAIPSPSAAALLGLGGLVASRRRRS